MDSFLSETLSSEPSTSQEVETNPLKCKLRKTEDLISISMSDSPDVDHPETTVAVQPVTSFLSKIDLSENAVPLLKKSENEPDLRKQKQKKFKLGRSAVEARTFTVSKLTKFPKIKLVIKNNKATKYKEAGQRKKSKKDLNSSNRPKKKFKSYDGKENEVSRSSSSKVKKKSKRSNTSSFNDLITPCKVVLERLPLETIRPFLRKLKRSSTSSTSSFNNLISPCKVMLEKLSPEMVRAFSKSDTSALEFNNFNNVERKARSLNGRRNSINYSKIKKMQRSLAVDEELPFSPKDSSSPMYKADKSKLSQGTDDRNATFEINHTPNKINDTEHKNDKLDVSGVSVLSSSTKNLTYELIKSNDLNEVTYEVADACTTIKPAELSESGAASSTSSRRSTFTKEDCVTPMPVLKKSELVAEVQKGAFEIRQHDTLEGESPPWDQNKENNSPSLMNSTYTRSVEETPDQDLEPVEVTDLEKSVSSAEASESSEDNLDVNQNEEVDGSLIEISDEDASYNASAELSSKEVEETQVTLKSSIKQTSISFTQVTRPKSVIKTKDSISKKRKVTFSDMSIIIIDDDSDSEDSPKKLGTLVPTNFPSDSDNEDTQISDKKTERTPLRAYVRLTRTSLCEDEEEGCFQSPRVTSTSNRNNSVNRRTLAGRTPLRLNESKLSKRPSPSEKVTSSIPKKTKSIKKTKMPDFAKLHKKIYDNMLNLEEYSARKADRAKMLLSGQKPQASGRKSSPKKLSPKNQVTSKKRLNYENGNAKPLPTSTAQKPALPKNKAPKNIKAGYSRYGFKLSENCDKKEQVEAVANKTRPQKKDSKNIQIKGVRCNRRFELLMKMRQKK